MITSQRLGSYVSAAPFQPFRVATASGRTFEVRHPEMIEVGRTTMTIFVTPQDGGSGGQQRVEVSLMLTESVEPFDAVRPVP